MKKKNFSIVKILLICLVVFIAIKWIIAVPVQKHYGYKELYKYMDAQGIKKENISEIKSLKDYLKGWYVFRVKLKDSPGYTLIYCYRDYKDDNKLSFEGMEYDLNGEFKSFNVKESEKFKYPPLPADLQKN